MLQYMSSHHAYVVAGAIEDGVERATLFAETLGIDPVDIETLRFGLFSVEEARKVRDLTNRRPLKGNRKIVIIAASRLFHEAQNALLKVFEEPAEGVVLALVVPSEGMLIATLRSRLLPLPGDATSNDSSADAFLRATKEEREKVVAKLLDRAKSDKAEEKQAARAETLALAEGLLRATYSKKRDDENAALLRDLEQFIPILHERSAPLKLILEHLLLIVPAR